MTTKFKKCPICKKEYGKLVSSMGLFYIVCPNKSQKHIVEVGPFKNIETAIKLWNGSDPIKDTTID